MSDDPNENVDTVSDSVVADDAIEFVCVLLVVGCPVDIVVIMELMFVIVVVTGIDVAVKAIVVAEAVDVVMGVM